MGESSSGVLVRSSHTEQLRNIVLQAGIDQDSVILHPVNAKWTGLFLADEYLLDEETISHLLDWSRHVPLLFVLYAADAGWAARVYHEGCMSFDIHVQWNDVPVTYVNGEWGAFALLGLRISVPRHSA